MMVHDAPNRGVKTAKPTHALAQLCPRLVNTASTEGEQELNSPERKAPTTYDGDMTPTLLVLASVGLGLAAGALGTAVVFGTRSLGRKRAASMRPELPPAAIELLHALDRFAVILDASLSPVYANPAARDDTRITGEQLNDAEFLKRARQVMSTGATDVIEPAEGDTIRLQIVRLQRRFLVVFADDLGEEQRVNAMRRDFIANVSHELKTPIAAISLLSEAVLEAADEPEIVRSFAKKLHKESRRLGDLSRDIIQLSEAQTSLQPEEREAVALRAVVRTEVEAHQEFAAQQGITIVLDEDPALPESLSTLGRPSALGTVIANLLTNAIRHSPEGSSVGIGIDVEDNNCRITVKDQGEGIAAEHLPRIFERFYRVDNARSRDGGGTGLGLSIARHTMRAHGGDISVWSQQGVGSSFTLTFPLIEDELSEKERRRKKKRATRKKRGEDPRPKKELTS